jgi:uncharacterized protein
MAHTVTAIEWLEWGDPAFARSLREDRPILLALVAPWCQHCAAMDRTTYVREDVVRIVNSRFVPVRVNSDRRPDINERYNLGGWPTTAFLTPGGDILTGGTFIQPDRMPAVLTDVADAFVRRRAEIAAHPANPATAGPPRASAGDDDPVEWLSAQLVERFDRQQGGFGEGAKFPHVPALTLALERYRETGDGRYAEMVVTSLHGLASLQDEVEGGFFRYAASRDWSRPHTEKLLQDNAELIRLYLEAGVVLERGEYLETAARAIRWAETVLADGREGGFGTSQAADETYYGLASADARATRTPPAVDPTQYSDANAETVAVFLRAADVLGEDWLCDAALRSLERILVSAYRPGAGVAHVAVPEPAVWGLLADQVRVTEALLQAQTVSGQLPYSMLAAELMEFALRTMWDDERGGFRDRAGDRPELEHGLLRQPARSFPVNCHAARVLHRLSIVTGQAVYRERAQQTLTSLGASYREDPLAGAAYGLAVREVRDGQLPSGLSLSYVDWKLSEHDDH